MGLTSVAPMAAARSLVRRVAVDLAGTETSWRGQRLFRDAACGATVFK